MSEERTTENLDSPILDSGENQKASKKLKKIIILSAALTLILLVVLFILIFVVFGPTESGDDSDDDDDDGSIIIYPNDTYTHCIIWLHGLDSLPEYFVDLFTKDIMFSKINNTKIILMRAPNTTVSYYGYNTTSWFDIYSFPINDSDTYNFDDAKNSSQKVQKRIEREAKKLGGKYENIFIGGHSQGACVTLLTGYTVDYLLGGVLVCSGILFPQAEIVGNKTSLNVMLGHGYKDKAIPLYYHIETVERISSFSGVETHYYPDQGHEIGNDEKKDMGIFLNENMK